MLTLDKISAYTISSTLSDDIWTIVSKWSVLAKKTIGDQLIRSTDSIAANIAEGEGRFFKKDKIKFFLQARGSCFEVIHWIEKAHIRELISDSEYQSIGDKLNQLPKEINFLIKNTDNNLKK